MKIAAKVVLVCAALAVAIPSFAASGDPEAGRKKSTTCQACHGANGMGVTPDFPNLAGQHPDYLATAIRHYQNGKRKNAIMAEQVKVLKSEKDILDVAAFYSHQQGLTVKY